MPDERLQGLVEKWRGAYRLHKGMLTNYAEAQTLKRCADELAAALATPEPGTWADCQCEHGYICPKHVAMLPEPEEPRAEGER